MTRYLTLAIALIASGAAFSQTSAPNPKPAVPWTIKKDSESIILTLPPGTVVNGSGKATINGKPVTIETIDKMEFTDGDLPTVNGEDLNILIRYTTKDMLPVKNYEDQNTRQMEMRKTDKGTPLTFWYDTYIYEDHPGKLKAARVSGNFVLTLTVENDGLLNIEDTKKMLLDILNNTTVTSETKPVIHKT